MRPDSYASIYTIRVGKNHIYTEYIRFLGRDSITYTIIYDAYTVLANPIHEQSLLQDATT
jgi:hypothetical protein